MLMSITFNSRTDRMAYLATADTNHLLGSFITNRIPPAYLMADFHSDRNGPHGNTFEWTNERQINSSMGSFPLTKTNSLIH